MPITIKSKTPGFRRCGIAHSDELVKYKDGHFTEEQIEILQDEPQLIVEIISSGATGTKAVSADDAIAMIQGAGDIDVLQAMVPMNEKRKTVMAAAAARRAELETPASTEE